MAGYSPWSHKGVGHDEATKQQQYIYTALLMLGSQCHGVPIPSTSQPQRSCTQKDVSRLPGDCEPALSWIT